MKARTHLATDHSLCGAPLELGEGTAAVALDTTARMAVDEQGLVHGGFVFGLADYAAMLAVNEPNVVLAGAESRFLKPVKRGDRAIAHARTVATEGRKHEVFVEVSVGATKVFDGKFTCFALGHHVLEGTESD